MTGLVLIYDFIEIEQQVCHQGPRCQLDRGDPILRLAVAEMNQFRGGLGIFQVAVLVSFKGGQYDL